MHFIIFSSVILLIIGIIWSIVVQPTEELQKKWREKWNDTTAFFAKKDPIAITLKVWVENSLENESKLQIWLLSLSDEGLEIMGEKISDFCEEMGVNIYWVIDPISDIELQKKQITEEIMINYCNICLKATQNL